MMSSLDEQPGRGAGVERADADENYVAMDCPPARQGRIETDPFDDEEKRSGVSTGSPMQPAQRTADGFPVHSFRDLLQDLATLSSAPSSCLA